MRALLFIVAIIAVGLKWYADACPGPKPPPPPPEKLTCLNGSNYRAVIFLVDGSWSMGDGFYTFKSNGSHQNVSNPITGKWGASYNQWRYILPLIVGFQEVITNQFVVVMKQYSSTNYLDECCTKCTNRNFTQVLRGKWTAADWNKSAEQVYGMHQNCDTQTYGYLIETVNTWEQKKKELKMEASARALIILITDGLPNNQTMKDGSGPNSVRARETLDRSSADLFLVYPNESNYKDPELGISKDFMTIVKNKTTDAFQFDFAKGRVNDTLRDDIVALICKKQQESG